MRKYSHLFELLYIINFARNVAVYVSLSVVICLQLARCFCWRCLYTLGRNLMRRTQRFIELTLNLPADWTVVHHGYKDLIVWLPMRPRSLFSAAWLMPRRSMVPVHGLWHRCHKKHTHTHTHTHIYIYIYIYIQAQLTAKCSSSQNLHCLPLANTSHSLDLITPVDQTGRTCMTSRVYWPHDAPTRLLYSVPQECKRNAIRYVPTRKASTVI